MFFLLSIICIGSYVLGQENFPQTCQNYTVTAQENFNFTQFLGKWYELEHSSELISNERRCATITLSKLNDYEAQIHMNNDTSSYGTIKKSNPDSTYGTLLITDKNSTEETNLIVVGTDYVNYAVVWVCKNYNGSESQSKQHLWIWSRNETLSANATATINNAIDNNNLGRFNLVKTVQGCNGTNGNNATSIHDHTTYTNATILPNNVTHTNGTISNGTVIHDHSTQGASGSASFIAIASTLILSLLIVNHM